MATNYFVKFTSYGLLTSDILLYWTLHKESKQQISEFQKIVDLKKRNKTTGCPKIK